MKRALKRLEDLDDMLDLPASYRRENALGVLSRVRRDLQKSLRALRRSQAAIEKALK